MLIKAVDITKSYRNSLGTIDRVVLKDLNLEIQKGSKVAIMGPSGSGKTTLLNILGTLDTADKGALYINEKLVSSMSETEILEIRSNTVGFVFQFHNLLPQCTLLENVLLPTLTQKLDKSKQLERAEELLKYMGIWEQRNNKPGELSGGECQRAAVARALINNPEILLADEPTGSLDAKNAELLLELLRSINEKFQVTLIIATHDAHVSSKMDTIFRINGL